MELPPPQVALLSIFQPDTPHLNLVMILPEYLETIFIGTPPVAGWPSDFHIITEWNPKQIVLEPQNREPDLRLHSQLEQEEFAHFSVTGCSADFTHQECRGGPFSGRCSWPGEYRAIQCA